MANDIIKQFTQYNLPDPLADIVGEVSSSSGEVNTKPLPQYDIPPPPPAPLNNDDVMSDDHGSVTDNKIYQGGASQQSSNFIPNTSGWFLGSQYAEFNFPISVDTLDIPDTVTASSFHVDINGNAWWGATTFAAAPAKISAAGLATFTGMSLVNSFTAGENVTKGALLCFKNKFACWGDDASADRNTTGVIDSMVYINPNSAGTNYQATKSLCFVGATGSGGDYSTLIKLALTGSPPGLPAWNEIDTIYLRLYVVFNSASPMGTFTLKRLTSAFTESTVTYTTRPTNDSIVWSEGKVVVESSGIGETNATTGTGTTTGYIDFDITELYRLISQGTFTNYGFLLENTNSAGVNVRFGGMNRAGGGKFNQAPFIISYITKDNPGSGNTMTANDGKVYLAANDNYQRVKQLAGIAASTEVSGSSVNVHSLANGTLIPSSVLTVVNNQTYYLNSNTGTIGLLTNNIIESNKWDIKIGTGGPNGLIIDKDTKPLFIRSFQNPTLVSSSVGFTSCLPPPDASMVVAQYQTTDGAGNIGYGQVQVMKGFLTQANDGWTYPGGGATAFSISLTWNIGTSGTVDATVSGGSSKILNVYFYK